MTCVWVRARVRRLAATALRDCIARLDTSASQTNTFFPPLAVPPFGGGLRWLVSSPSSSSTTNPLVPSLDRAIVISRILVYILLYYVCVCVQLLTTHPSHTCTHTQYHCRQYSAGSFRDTIVTRVNYLRSRDCDAVLAPAAAVMSRRRTRIDAVVIVVPVFIFILLLSRTIKNKNRANRVSRNGQ